MTMKIWARSHHSWAVHLLDWHRLAEGDVCAFEKTAADITGGGREIFAEGFINGGRFKALVTTVAGHQPVSAVDLNEFLAGNAGQTVQAVNVLRDEPQQLATLLEIADRVVADVRLNRLIELIGCLF